MLKFSTINFKLKLLLIAGLLAWIYYPTFLWMVERWSARDSYYGHGFLIPLVSLYWVWKRRQSLSSLGAEPNAWGAVLVVTFAVLQLMSSFFRIYFLSALSLMGLLLGAVLWLGGTRILRQIWFPILFLLLMVPMPLLLISQVTLKMKFFVSEVSANFLNRIGIQAVREGSYLYTPHAVLLVGDPCSGLRSFLAFLCLGFVFAYESKISLWKRIVLVAAGLPLALLSNTLRVLFLSLVGEIYGQKYTAGFIHDASGFAVFVIAFVIFLAIRQKLEGIHVSVKAR